ncbi:MAG: class I SAM-dependent methyltransferase [Oscillospiraceae bacterium]|nr:class I SAM-dependent methyltransferase [Oscillospiraceae bacterium]
MDKYHWNNQIEYLTRSRKAMWNNDYLQFLVEKVWKINSPVDIVDFGCGMGFMGLMFLPVLPEGSSYTGIDRGKNLLDEAVKNFSNSPYKTNFIEADLLEYRLERKYDIAICHTVLQHIPNPVKVMEKMRDSVVSGGRVICMEVDRNMANAALYFHGPDYSKLNNLGILQKLWLNDLKNEGSDHNVGVKIPAYMQEIGLKDIGVRLNDCVNFINAKGDGKKYKTEYDCFISGGWGGADKNKEKVVGSLIKRGLTKEEAEYQFECEAVYNYYVNENKDSACIFSALCQIISFGTV